MQVLQALSFILSLAFAARFWKTENVKLALLAFFFLCIAAV